MVINKSEKGKVLYGCIGLLGIVALCYIFTMTGLFIRGSSVSENKYCNTDNELYRFIRENAGQWTEMFPFTSQGTVPEPSYISFTTDDRQSFRAYVGFWLTEDNSPIFYVVTNPEWRDSLFSLGRKGLFYTPTGKLPIYEMDQIEELGHRIYYYSVD